MIIIEICDKITTAKKGAHPHLKFPHPGALVYYIPYHIYVTIADLDEDRESSSMSAIEHGNDLSFTFHGHHLSNVNR